MKKDSTIILRTVLLASVCLAFAFSGAMPAMAQDIDSCLACHQDQNLTKKDAAGKVHNLYVDKDAFQKSVHGEMGYACVDCHVGVQAKKHPAGGIKPVSCSTAECHTDVKAAYGKSRHGELLQAGNPNAPHCYDCHTRHAVMKSADKASSTNPGNLQATCGVCHDEQAKQGFVPLVLDFVRGEQPASAFTLTSMASVLPTRVKGHGKDNLAYTYSTKNCENCHADLVSHGSEPVKAAVCFSCHGQQKPGIVFGKIHKANVVQSPFLSVLLALGYIAAIAGLVFFFRPVKKSGEDDGAAAV